MQYLNPRTLMESAAFPLEIKENDPNGDPIRDAIEGLIREFGEFRTKQDGRFDDIEKKRLAKLVERLDAFEAKLNRPGQTKSDDEPSAERKAFINFIRKGREALDLDEIKALTTAVPADGGYINSPAEFLKELDRNLVQYSPIRSVARVSTISVGEVILPKRTGGPTAVWVEETETRTGTQPVYGSQTYTTKEAACYVDVSNRLIEDAAFNIEGELSHDLGEEFGRLESDAFWNGGAAAPTGIYAAGIQRVHSAGPNALVAEDLIDLLYSLPSPYAANATWAMSRGTMAVVRKLKATDGHFLWVDGLSAGQPPTILGRPVIECSEAEDVVGGDSPSTTVPIVLGDWSHFRIFDRVSTAILRDPYSVQLNGQVRFHARRRVTGGVSKVDAFRMLEVG